jgi:hypothetical protein
MPCIVFPPAYSTAENDQLAVKVEIYDSPIKNKTYDLPECEPCTLVYR